MDLSPPLDGDLVLSLVHGEIQDHSGLMNHLLGDGDQNLLLVGDQDHFLCLHLPGGHMDHSPPLDGDLVLSLVHGEILAHSGLMNLLLGDGDQDLLLVGDQDHFRLPLVHGPDRLGDRCQDGDQDHFLILSLRLDRLGDLLDPCLDGDLVLSLVLVLLVDCSRFHSERETKTQESEGKKLLMT